MSMTVLSVAYPFAPVRADTSGGSEQILLTMDRALVEKGHRSVVLACDGSEVNGILVSTPEIRGTIDDHVRARMHAAFREALQSILRNLSVNLVHMHSLDFAAYRPYGVPVLTTLHLPPSWYPEESFSPVGRSYFVCVSRSQQAVCPPISGLLPCICNGVDVDRLSGLRSKGQYVLALGRICPEKGYHIALDAAKRADIPMVLAGRVYPYDSHLRYYEEQIRPRLDGRRYVCVGQVGFERKRRLLLGARCLLIPSLAPETSSLVAMESLAAGTPVVAFSSGALSEIVEEGMTGFLVRDGEEMARMIGMSERIDPETCRNVARERFSAGRMIHEYFKVYECILNNTNADSDCLKVTERDGNMG